MVISFLFGGYMAYLFTKIRYIGGGFIMHAYCKFMGIPNIIALLRMDTQQDLTAKSMNYIIIVIFLNSKNNHWIY